jgi:hypothetical protein
MGPSAASRLAAAALAAVALASPGPGLARSSVVDEVQAWAKRYHQDPPRLDSLRARMAAAAKSDPDPENLMALAQIAFIWGDIRGRTPDERLEAYETGRQAAQRAMELAPASAQAQFLYGANTARWGQVKGIAQSLFLLPSVKRAIGAALDLDPRFAPTYALAGNVYYEVPAFLGGDLAYAERMFRKGLELEPRFTAMRVGLAKVLIKRGRTAEARRELQAVLDEPSPENPAHWTMRDTRNAHALLASLQGRS